MAETPPGWVTTQRTDRSVTLCVHGEFDVALSLPVVEGLGDDETDVEIDLSAVTFMDSTAIRLLLLTRSEALASGRSWSITATSAVAYDLLSVTGLVERFAAPTPAGGDPTFR